MKSSRESPRRPATRSRPAKEWFYPLLHALEKDGALRAREQPAGGRTRIYYTLTSKGVRRLFDQTDNWTRLTRAVQSALRGPAHAV